MRVLKDIIKFRRDAESLAVALPALMMEAENIATSITHGEHAKRKAGTGQKFWQYRDYTPGDRPQDIDWRQSAKTDHVFIRQKELQTTQKTFFWTAAGKSMAYSSAAGLPSKHECAAVLTLSLALLLLRGEEQIGVFGDSKTGHSEKRLEYIANALMDSKRYESLPPADHFTLPRHSTLIQLGDFLAPLPEIENTFSKIAATAEKSLVIQILDPAELELDFTGRVLFEGNNPQDHEMINHVASIRTQYQERIQDHIRELQNLCRRHNWHYILHRTDTSKAQTLSAIWQMTSVEGAMG